MSLNIDVKSGEGKAKMGLCYKCHERTRAHNNGYCLVCERKRIRATAIAARHSNGRSHRHSRADLSVIRKLSSSGVSGRSIAKILGTTAGAVNYQIRKMRAEARP